jgi:hypothetical protein
VYYYCISYGNQGDYDSHFTFLGHNKKFTKKEFVNIYNDVMKTLENKKTRIMAINIIIEMVEKFGFKEILPLWEINSLKNNFIPLSLEEINEEEYLIKIENK